MFLQEIPRVFFLNNGQKRVFKDKTRIHVFEQWILLVEITFGIEDYIHAIWLVVRNLWSVI